MSDEAIRIECPGCHRKFRMRSRGSSGRTAVKCPKCGAKILLPSTESGSDQTAPSLPVQSSRPAPPTPPSVSTTDAELRRMLLRAKKRRTTDLTDTNQDSDRTQQDIHAPRDETDPDGVGDFGATMPMGRKAMTARDLGTDSVGDRVGAATIRRRLDTPRAGSMVPAPSLRPPIPPPEIERPVVDEPTYTGPMPGRSPQITPSGSDLSRFLQPGNYFVRVEDSVYEPVSEKDLVRLLNAGVFFAIDELRPEDGQWIPISSPELFSDLKGRLAHRAHHMLARVAPPRPASDFGRPAPPEPEPEPAPIAPRAPEPPSVIVHEDASIPDEAAPLPAPKRKSKLLLVLPAVALLLMGIAGAVFLLVPNASTWARGMASSEPDSEDADAANLAILAAEDAGEFDPVPAFQSAYATVNSAAAVADTIDGMLTVATETNDEHASTLLSFEKWKRKPTTVEPGPLIAALMKRKQWYAARQVANWSQVTHGDSKELRDTIDASLREQFASEAPVIISKKGFNRFLRVDPGKRPALIIEDSTGGQWTIWPNLGEDQWKNDIAAYRLCQLIVCHFRIPETREIKIDEATFKALVDASPDDAKEMVTRVGADFSWDDGTLVGSMRPMPPGAPWPIELSQIWRPWLTAGSGLAQLDDSVEQAHQQVAFFGADQVYDEVQGMKARQMARQVSSILLVDYLVNNWNRFAPTEEDWGSRTHIDDGLISSVEDSAAFFPGDSVRVRGRFSWSKRFSRATVESIKQLDQKTAGEMLFPNPTKADLEKLDNLWTQRSRALRRIEKLVKKYGAEDVFALDARPKEGNR